MNVDGIYIVKGDTTCDQRITLEDLAFTQMHILGVSELTGDAFTAGDTSDDNQISILDLANINKHLMGVVMLTEVVNNGKISKLGV